MSWSSSAPVPVQRRRLVGTRSQTVGASVAAVTHSDWVVPASRGHWAALRGAGAAHALSARPAVVLGDGRGEGLGAVVALRDVLVGHPVVGTSNVLHET